MPQSFFYLLIFSIVKIRVPQLIRFPTDFFFLPANSLFSCFPYRLYFYPSYFYGAASTCFASSREERKGSTYAFSSPPTSPHPHTDRKPQCNIEYSMFSLWTRGISSPDPIFCLGWERFCGRKIGMWKGREKGKRGGGGQGTVPIS